MKNLKALNLIVVLIFSVGFAQTKISGFVVDEQNETVPFANIVFVGSTTGTVSDENGKFYLESDNDSPGRIGVWIGWQIIKSYMKNNDVTLQKLMDTSPEIIYNKSKYKPRKN